METKPPKKRARRRRRNAGTLKATKTEFNVSIPSAISKSVSEEQRSDSANRELLDTHGTETKGPLPLAKEDLNGSFAYESLIVSRCAQGLLKPFECVVCRAMALNPIGWNGHREPLCARCADPIEKRAK